MMFSSFCNCKSALTAAGGFYKITSDESPADTSHKTTIGERKAYFEGGWLDVSIFAGEYMSPGTNVAGPAIIEYQHSETVLPPQTIGEVDQAGNLIITLLK